MNDTQRWQAVEVRDGTYDGRFVYAVRSTGIYCRPSCPARRPRRDQVQFFSDNAQAEQAGFRPCLRCTPQRSTPDEPHLELVARICRVLEDGETSPTLAELSQQFHLSPQHLQRVFKRIVGVSPRQYALAQRTARFRLQLQGQASITSAVYDAGFQSASSAYDADALGMTPTEYQQGGVAATISYTIVACDLGWLLVATTPRGLCVVRLGDTAAELEHTLQAEFPAALLQRDDAQLQASVHAILSHLDGTQPHLDLPLDVRATAFQQRVWAALRAIPYGSTRSYGDVAQAIGQPTAARAVAQACAANPVALVIPCQRVVRENGETGGYRWGVQRKQALLEREQRYGPTSSDS